MASRRKSALQRYCEKILDGREVACQKMRKLAARLLAEIKDRKGRWRFDIDAAERPVHFIEEFCKIPSGRLGQPLKLEEYEKAWIEALFGFVDRDGLRKYTEAFILVARKNGKALSLDESIPTPDGWKRMRDVHVGDLVFGKDGRPSRVLYESPTFNKPMYTVRFEDGSEVCASADHVWTVKTRKSKRRGKTWFDLTTEDMAGDFMHQRADGVGVEYKYRVPMNGAVEYPEKELPVHPYVLGVWLGDGTRTKGELTLNHADAAHIASRIEECGYPVERVSYPSDRPNGADRYIVDRRRHGSSDPRDPKSFRNTLKSMGVLDHKRIPEEYLHASVEQRWELLRGLMDTDGYCSKSGECEFTQVDEAMALQVLELIRSLGIKATFKVKPTTLNGNPYGTTCRITFYTNRANSCFSLERKTNRLKTVLADRMKAKSVVSVERCEDVPSKCIMVDNQDHLYLAGTGFTATHNTSIAAAVELYMLVADGEGAPQVYNAANNLEQATLGYNAAIKMVRQSRDIAAHVSKQTDQLYCDLNFGFIRPMASNVTTLDGLDVHCAVIDEMHAAKTRDVYDLMKQGTAAREQPLILQITTNGFVRNSIFDAQYEYASRWLDGTLEDERFIAFMYELDDRSEWEDESAWKKANPGLGTVKSLEYLRGQVKKAKSDPAYLPTVLTKDFNMPENSSVAWLSFEEAVNQEAYDIRQMGFKYGVVGFDAADTIDLTCATMLMMRPGDDRIYSHSMYWIPEDVVLEADRNGTHERDDVPYRLWIARGLMRTVPGNKVDKQVIIDWMEEMRDEYDVYPYACGFDPWHIGDHERRELERVVGKSRSFPLRQGAQTLSQPMKQIRKEYGIGRIVDNHNPVNEWCRMNVMVKTDVNANIQPEKRMLNPKNRIDGFMAELMAYKILCDLMDDYQNIC